MRLLVLGGTAWLGRAIVTAALDRGHEVTCVTRGSGIPSGAVHVAADRDDPGALHAIATQRWDAVIDVTRQPGHARRAARALEPAAARYVIVSSCSVYASQAEIGGDESVALLPALDSDSFTSPDDYGSAKVACEQAVLDAFGTSRSTIVRAGLIAGPGDPSGRAGYWPRRFASPSSPSGAVLAPDAPELPVGVIDVRDLADWLVACATSGVVGIFNAMGEWMPLPRFLETARLAAGHTGPLVRAPEPWLVEHGVADWSGPRSLPLWIADRDWYGMNSRSIARAVAAGLTLRPLEQTLRDILAESDRVDTSRAGLTDADERELLAAFGT